MRKQGNFRSVPTGELGGRHRKVNFLAASLGSQRKRKARGTETIAVSLENQKNEKCENQKSYTGVQELLFAGTREKHDLFIMLSLATKVIHTHTNQTKR